MRAHIDEVLAVLPFEPAAFRRLGGPPCAYVGHPLVDRIAELTPSAEEETRREASPPLLLVLPGSRRAEVARLMPVFGEALAILARRFSFEVVLPVVPQVEADIHAALASWPIRPRLATQAEKYTEFRRARAALAVSGVVTLELALAGTPMVVAYKVAAVEALLKFLVRVDSFALPNLVLGERIAPEFLQEQATPQALAAALAPLLGGGAERETQRRGLERVRALVLAAGPSPSAAAAARVLAHLRVAPIDSRRQKIDNRRTQGHPRRDSRFGWRARAGRRCGEATLRGPAGERNNGAPKSACGSRTRSISGAASRSSRFSSITCPEAVFERFTFRNVSISDSAELFVFLAGWALRKLTDGRGREPLGALAVLAARGPRLHRLCRAARHHEAAIALLAAVSFRLDAPFLLDWHNASAMFNDPVRAHIGLVALSYQLGYFNILPLYVVLMLVSPLIALAHRHAPRALPLVALAIYVGALVSGVNFSDLAERGRLVLRSACLAAHLCARLSARRRGRPRRLRAPASAPAAPRRHADSHIRRHRGAPRFFAGPDRLCPSPSCSSSSTRPILSPARLLHSLALVALFAGLYPHNCPMGAAMLRFLSLLGRNSLNVFCAGSLLSLAGQIVRFVSGGGIVIDAAIVIFGVGSLGAVAWASEWRNRLRAKSSRASAA